MRSCLGGDGVSLDKAKGKGDVGVRGEGGSEERRKEAGEEGGKVRVEEGSGRAIRGSIKLS